MIVTEQDLANRLADSLAEYLSMVGLISGDYSVPKLQDIVDSTAMQHVPIGVSLKVASMNLQVAGHSERQMDLELGMHVCPDGRELESKVDFHFFCYRENIGRVNVKCVSIKQHLDMETGRWTSEPLPKTKTQRFEDESLSFVEKMLGAGDD